jgi:hypothetical protein
MKSPFYPPADRTSQWFSKLTSASRTSNRLVLWHCTEMGVPGEPWPTYTYQGLVGGSAPHFTVKPDRANKRLLWRQHWRADESCRALAHPTGTPETNNSGVLQIELGGTSVEGDPGYRWWEPDDWALRDLHAFSVWARDEWGIPMIDQGRRWVHNKRVGKYVVQQGPPSRLTWGQWAAARGHIGHEHAPGNDHVDPGALPVPTMLAQEAGLSAAEVDQINAHIDAAFRANADPYAAALLATNLGSSGPNVAVALQSGFQNTQKIVAQTDTVEATLVTINGKLDAIAASIANLSTGSGTPVDAAVVRAALLDVLGGIRLTQG